MKFFLPLLALVTLSSATEIRVATYNTSLALTTRGRLSAELRTKSFSQAQQVAEVIQILAPDIILLNEFDYDAGSSALTRFNSNYLKISQGGQTPIDYPYRYTAPSNTGIHSGFDLDGNGQIDSTSGDLNYGGDAWGFGEFEGKYGMAILSKYPIETDAIRTFQLLKWKSMPENVIPSGFYSEEEEEDLRLSSKSHWDVPIMVQGQKIHLLCSHPTPPVFDGSEDRNGRRNHDEIRLWADYLTNEADYLIDDLGHRGGLPQDARFILLGDQNADPTRGDSFDTAIAQWLEHPRINASFSPERSGTSSTAARFDTSTFGLRVDYVLPSQTGFKITAGAVFWPTGNSLGANRVTISDHRPVYLDLEILPTLKEAIRDLSIQKNEAGGTITWRGISGVEYEIQQSGELIHWTPFDVTISSEGGVWSASFPLIQAPRFLRIVMIG